MFRSFVGIIVIVVAVIAIFKLLRLRFSILTKRRSRKEKKTYQLKWRTMSYQSSITKGIVMWVRARVNESVLIHAKHQIYAHTLLNSCHAISRFCGDRYGGGDEDEYNYDYVEPFTSFYLYFIISPDDFLVFRFHWNSIVPFKISTLNDAFIFQFLFFFVSTIGFHRISSHFLVNSKA